MKKRVLSMLLAGILLCSLLSPTAFAAETTFKGETIEYGGADCKTDENGNLILTYTSTSTVDSLTIPEGYTAIADILAVGGGGGGGGGYTASGALYYGNGGNGGEVKEVECVLKAGTYTVNVGAGGSGSNSTPAIAKGSDGKPTKVECNEWSVIAKGGAGGLCRQSKNNAIAGTPLTGVMSNITQNLYGEGGAKGSGTAKVSDETANTGNGGNGGPASSNATNRKGGAGGSGVVVIRIKKTDCVFIKSPSGTIFSESCDPEDFVSSVKTALCINLFGCASDLLQLYYDGVLLSDDRTLSSYGISLGDTLEFRMLPHNGNVYRGTETAELFPNNQLEILIENNIESKDALDCCNALYIGTADSYQQSNINELAKRCSVQSYIFSQSEDGYSAVSEYDLTDRLTMKGETARGISYPADGTADIVATKFVYALYRELIENVNNKSYDKIFLSFNGDLADGADGEDDCLNITKYANALGDSIVGRTDTQILNELKNVLDTLYYEGKIVWLTPGSSYGTDGYTSESTGNFANYILGGYGYKNPVQIPQTDSEVFKRFFFGEYTTLLVEDTLAPGLTVKAIIPQIEEDGVWYDIPDEGYTESRSGEVIKATAESSDDTNQIKVKFDISDYRKWAYEYEMCIQPDLRVKVICDASDEFIQTYTAEEHPDFDNTICTYEGVIDECIYENYEFHIDSPDIKCVEEEIHLHSVECPDCGETVSDSALTKCPKCGADLENSAMVFTAWDKTDSLPDTAGNWYLTEDVTPESTWVVPAGTTNLCLNGHIINGNNQFNSIIEIKDDAVFNLYDCDTQTEHKGYLANTNIWHPGEKTEEWEIEKNIIGGIITGGGKLTDEYSGACVKITEGKFNMYSGNIAGNTESFQGEGGVVYVGNNCTFNMFGGNLFGNKGGLEIDGGVATMNDGCISGTASNSAVYFNRSGGSFTMNGGSLNNNYTDGIILGNNGKVVVNGGKICENMSSGISAFGGILNITGGEISGNGEYGYGGIYITANADVTISGGNIINNHTTNEDFYGWGGIYFDKEDSDSGASLTVGGTARIAGNTAGEYTSNLCLYKDGSVQNQISVGTGEIAPEDGMLVGVSIYDYDNEKLVTGKFTDDTVAEEQLKYFFADDNADYVNFVDDDSDYFELKSSADNEYTIKTAVWENGVVYTDKQYATKDTDVTLTVVPDAGYRLVEDSLTVSKTGEPATKVTAIKQQNGTYQFKMPEYPVTVTAEFEFDPPVKFTKTQAQWEDKAAGKWNLGIVGTFNTGDIPIEFNDNGASKNVSAVGVIIRAGEKYEQQTTRFVYETGVENEYCYRAVIKNIPYNVSSEKTITVQFFATVDGKKVLGETKTINLADAYATAINNGMPAYEG